MHTMRQANAESLLSPESFWTHHASALHWHRPPSSALARYPKTVHTGADTDRDTDTNGNQAHYNAWTWFPDGEISTTYNCVDRHVEAGLGDRAAIIWDSPVTGAKETWTYARLLDEVEVLAGVLREEGVARGDVVIIYMPMIPQALVAALAITRLGAIHAAVFGGFAASSLAQRIDAARPKAIVTASCGIEGSKGAIPYRPLVEGAIKASVFKPSKTLIYQRDAHRWNQPDKRNGQRNWQRLVKSARMRGIRARSPVAVRSDEGLYVIYTSGTTGLPKGVVREAGGHAVGLALSIKQLFGVRGPGDVMFCASDIGWVVGHSYILYAPLLVGATTVLFEGKPVGTPDAGTFWRIIEEHRVNVLFTAPTAMRAIRKEDPANRFFKAVAARGGLRQLRALFLAGERSEPSIVETFQALLSQHAAPGARVVDNWWSSESGSPITGLALGLESESESESESPSPTTIRPGSAGLPTPGFDVRIVNDSGTPLPHGTMGNIVLGLPLGPTAFTRLFHDAGDARFYKSYLQRFGGRWLDTGDAGVIDHDGFVHVMARSDDIINVAAHRFSTGAIEQVILAHPRVAEAVVVGVPDALKGVLPFAFVHVHVHVSQGSSQGPPGGGGGGGGGGDIPVTDAKLFSEVNALVREQIGAIASLGGMIQGRGMIPKTRSGKTLRRVLRELVELAARGDLGETTTVNVPPTVEDGEVVGVARGRVREFFTSGSGSGSGAGAKAKL